MKHIFIVLALAISSISSVFGQNCTQPSSQSQLQSTISHINTTCPVPSGPGLTLTSVELADSGIRLNFEVNEQTLSIDTLSGQKDMLHQVYVSQFISGTEPGIKAMRQYCLAFDKPIVFHFSGTITDDTFDITLQPSELK